MDALKQLETAYLRSTQSNRESNNQNSLRYEAKSRGIELDSILKGYEHNPKGVSRTY